MEIQNTPTLKTERLLLRKFAESDIDALLAIYKDKEVNRYLPWFLLHSRKEAELFFQERYAKAYRQATGYSYAICMKTENIPIGYVHLSGEESHDLGYGVRKEFWHKGIVTEASSAVVEQAKRDGLSYLTATHDVENPRSGQVMKRLGMRYRYSYEEQWQPKNKLVTFRMYQLNFAEGDEGVYQKYWNASVTHWIEVGVE